MMISWNVRGLDKHVRSMEVGAHLTMNKVSCVALLETRVKINNKEKSRKHLGLDWHFIDNYAHHLNGRIWLGWDHRLWHIKEIGASDQYLHCEVSNSRDDFSHFLTVIYAQNQLTNRRKLWADLQTIGISISKPWIIIGDFNNVLRSDDRIEGSEVHEFEYRDLEYLMESLGLFEHDTKGPHFTWSNKHADGLIYSRIDRALCNRQWFTKYQDSVIEILQPHISDHSPLKLSLETTTVSLHRRRFQFLNVVIENPEYMEQLKNSWQQEIVERPMFRLWKKLIRLQPVMKALNKAVTEEVRKIQECRDKLDQAQKMLQSDVRNPEYCRMVKHWTEELLKQTELEEKILKQKAKIDWIQLGDGNNAYFFANLKAKNK
ncbi:uncharacterized protein LOC131621801 [Vicia villosa]|uniref:uncharacterized protein LOC131621801 n=1 Tax=Vicia villosa TaxID=3911 RepID=UPI00273B4792|nr:uncharacterized protein LOC131621801 [Vicia villosa]